MHASKCSPDSSICSPAADLKLPGNILCIVLVKCLLLEGSTMIKSKLRRKGIIRVTLPYHGSSLREAGIQGGNIRPGGTFLISRLCLEVYKGQARLLPPCKLGFQRTIPHWLLRSLSWGKVKVDRQPLSGQLAVSTWTEERGLEAQGCGGGKCIRTSGKMFS